METLDRVVEGIRIGIPIDLLRKSHPDVIIRDCGDSFKLLLRGEMRFVEATKVINKGDMVRARIMRLNGGDL
jgi:hypothetical protein